MPEELINDKKEELSGSEAIFGFCGWLTSRNEQTIMSASNDAAPIADLIEIFCETNKLTEPRKDWGKNLIHPPKAVLVV